MKNITGITTLLAAATLVAPAQAATTVKGSDTVLPLSQALAESYMNSRPRANISVTGGGSTVGLTALINGNTDIANSSRPVAAKEFASAKARGFVPKVTRIAKDGLCVILNPDNPVKSLSMDQVGAIYSGSISNWSQVGGPNQRIVVTGRDSSSGTYGFFRDTLFPGRPYRSDMLTLPSNNAIAITVSREPGAIGYIGIAFYEKWEGKVKAVPVAEKKGGAPVAPSVKTVSDGTYPLFRYLFMVTRGNPKGEAADFIKFALSPQGQQVVTKVGYVPVR